jgi:hypothetical protein
MTLTHRMEWNGNHGIIILDNGAHGHIEMTLDEFLAFVGQLRDDLLLHDQEPFLPSARPRQD